MASSWIVSNMTNYTDKFSQLWQFLENTMTLDTPRGLITKFLKKWLKNAGKMRGKIFFPHFGF